MSLRELVAAFYAWCYHSPALSIFRDTKLGIPAVQTVHLIGITIVLGTAVTMNLRYLNLGYRDLDARSFVTSLWTWFRRGLLLTVTAGFVVFLPDPARYVANTSFRVKMAVLSVAILYQFTVSAARPVRFPRPAEPRKRSPSRRLRLCSGSASVGAAERLPLSAKTRYHFPHYGSGPRHQIRRRKHLSSDIIVRLGTA